jgi:hypothetical protein
MDKYHPDEVKFFQGFHYDHDENAKFKRVFSLKIKIKEISEKWLELKNRCENDEDKSFLKEWISQYDSNLFNKLSFRQKINYGFWRRDDDEYKDTDIIILYCEYVSDDVLNKINKCDDYITKFNFKWNFEILKPIIADFVNYANKYTLEDSISGRIEFVHTGEKVNVCYL